MDQQARLQELLEVESKAKIVECFVDVFGFSRGAAEARVFCKQRGPIADLVATRLPLIVPFVYRRTAPQATRKSAV